MQKMNLEKTSPRLLGVAFLLQAVVSLISGLILFTPLIEPGSITGTMTNISNNSFQMRASIAGEMITSIGIVLLGTMLYVSLRDLEMSGNLAAFPDK